MYKYDFDFIEEYVTKEMGPSYKLWSHFWGKNYISFSLKHTSTRKVTGFSYDGKDIVVYPHEGKNKKFADISDAIQWAKTENRKIEMKMLEDGTISQVIL